MFNRPHLARAPDARLHFVNDEQDAVLVADAAQTLQKSLGGRHIAAFALHRFDYDRGDFFGRGCRLKQTFFDPIQSALGWSTIAALVGAERIAIVVRERHVNHVEQLALETTALRHS